MSLMDCLKQECEVKQQHFHVLAVDDSKIDRKLLKRLLTVSSYQVTCVDSGDKALEYLGIVEVEENEYKRLTPSRAGTSCAPATNLTPLLITIEVASRGGFWETPNSYRFWLKMNWDLHAGLFLEACPCSGYVSENEPSRINMCLEGGAEEFLLKPVKLSDVRKIHSHLQSSITTIERTKNFKGEDKEKNNNCSDINKRKATQTVPSQASGKRPRVKNLQFTYTREY